VPGAAHRHGVLAERQSSFFTQERKAPFQTKPAIAKWMNIDQDKVVLHQRIHRRRIWQQDHRRADHDHSRAAVAQKLNAPVMMRISREEEHYIGRARPSVEGPREDRVREGRQITGARHVHGDCNSGAYDAQGDGASSARIVSLLYQPPAMRWRAISVMTNTPPRSAQSAPGGMQGIAIIEPILAKAARKLGVDQVALRRVNCPEGKGGVRTAESWQTGARDELLFERGAGPRRGAVQMAGARGAPAQTNRLEGARRGRLAQHFVGGTTASTDYW
jgi:CO/xanthine dehydrogenase Mo-binding subunit